MVSQSVFEFRGKGPLDYIKNMTIIFCAENYRLIGLRHHCATAIYAFCQTIKLFVQKVYNVPILGCITIYACHFMLLLFGNSMYLGERLI